MQAIEKILEVLANALMWVCGISLTAMMLHVSFDVAAKYLFNHPIPGTPEIVARYYMLSVVFLPIPLVELRNNAIVVDLFYENYSRGLQRFCVSMAYFGQTLFFGLLAYNSTWDALESIAKREFIDAQIPIIVWPASIILPLGFGLAFLVSILRLVQILTRADWRSVIAPRSALQDNPLPQEAA